jgi:O-antigen/teichoic acid export membrane protein
LSTLYQSVISKLTGSNSETAKSLSKQSIATIIIQVLTIIFTAGASFFVAKYAGAEVYGTYSYAFSLVSLITMLVLFGFDDLLLREVAKAGEKAALFYLVKSYKYIILHFLIILLLSILYYYYFYKHSDLVYVVSLSCVLLFASLRIQLAALKGAKKIIQSQIPEYVIKPLVFFLFVVIFWTTESELSVKSVFISALLAHILAALFSFISFKNLDFNTKLSNNELNYKAVFVFFLLNIVSVLSSRADVVIMGLLTDAEQVGIYNLSARLADFISFSLMAIQMVIAAYIAQYYWAGEKEKLQKLLQTSSILISVSAISIYLFMVIVGTYILGFFGEEYASAYTSLVIVGLGKLIYSIAGLGSLLLLMTKHEKQLFRFTAIGVIVSIILNFLLIPSYGAVGAAIASCSGFFVWNVLIIRFCNSTLQLKLSFTNYF